MQKNKAGIYHVWKCFKNVAESWRKTFLVYVGAAEGQHFFFRWWVLIFSCCNAPTYVTTYHTAVDASYLSQATSVAHSLFSEPFCT